MNENGQVSLKDFMVLMGYFRMSRLRRRCSIDDCPNLATGYMDIGLKRIYICENCLQKVIETYDQPFDYDLL